MRALDFARASMETSTSAKVEPDPRLASVVQTSLVAAETFTFFQSAFEEAADHPLLANARSSQIPEAAVGVCCANPLLYTNNSTQVHSKLRWHSCLR